MTGADHGLIDPSLPFLITALVHDDGLPPTVRAWGGLVLTLDKENSGFWMTQRLAAAEVVEQEETRGGDAALLQNAKSYTLCHHYCYLLHGQSVLGHCYCYFYHHQSISLLKPKFRHFNSWPAGADEISDGT